MTMFKGEGYDENITKGAHEAHERERAQADMIAKYSAIAEKIIQQDIPKFVAISLILRQIEYDDIDPHNRRNLAERIYKHAYNELTKKTSEQL